MREERRGRAPAVVAGERRIEPERRQRGGVAGKPDRQRERDARQGEPRPDRAQRDAEREVRRQPRCGYRLEADRPKDVVRDDLRRDRRVRMHGEQRRHDRGGLESIERARHHGGQVGPRSRASATAASTPRRQGSPWPVSVTSASSAASLSSDASASALSAVAAPETIWAPVEWVYGL